ncbi:MAG: transglutaminase domain-containing protein, partial [Myxococcales bacterium]|nr:transglutaminase domain-containing protein [Myxococcales bacterium]
GGKTSPTDAPTTAEITVVRDGLHVRIRGEMRGRPTPTRLAAVLPEGAASTIILGPGVWRPKDEARSLAVDRADRGRVPPVVALLQAHDVAFGWYPRPGDALWQRWVAVLDDTPATAKALQAQGIRIGGASPTLHTARRGGAVVLASDPELLAQTLPRIGTASAAAPLLAGTFDGHVAGAALAGFGAFGGLGKEGTRAVAMLLGIVRRAEYDAVLDPGTGLVTLSGRLQLSAAAEETPEIVDAWLAARDDGNSTRLPRRVAARELGAPLSYVFEVDDGVWFADDVLSRSPRTRVTVRDAHHVQVDVRPAAEAPASALDAAQRREHIAATNSFPSRDPAITSLLGSIVDDAKSATDRATKINAFVHGRLRYAVTPQHLDGVEVLTAGEGDCSEYATLTVTLLRAASIPAVLVQGMVASGDRMVAHAWVSYHDGQRWREIDPTAGTMGVTSGHLELSVVDALSLHAMGRLLVTGVTGAAK